MEEQQTKPALVKNPSTGSRKMGRRVAFEVPSSRIMQSRSSDISDIHSSIDHLEKGRHHPCCFACCAWGCILVFIFIIVLLFAGISYLGFLKAGMPKVNVRSINITRLQVRTDLGVLKLGGSSPKNFICIGLIQNFILSFSISHS